MCLIHKRKLNLKGDDSIKITMWYFIFDNFSSQFHPSHGCWILHYTDICHQIFLTNLKGYFLIKRNILVICLYYKQLHCNDAAYCICPLRIFCGCVHNIFGAPATEWWLSNFWRPLATSTVSDILTQGSRHIM